MDHREETYSSLKFATRAANIKNAPVVNTILDPKELLKENIKLKQEIMMLKKELNNSDNTNINDTNNVNITRDSTIRDENQLKLESLQREITFLKIQCEHVSSNNKYHLSDMDELNEEVKDLKIKLLREQKDKEYFKKKYDNLCLNAMDNVDDEKKLLMNSTLDLEKEFINKKKSIAELTTKLDELNVKKKDIYNFELETTKKQDIKKIFKFINDNNISDTPREYNENHKYTVEELMELCLILKDKNEELISKSKNKKYNIESIQMINPNETIDDINIEIIPNNNNNKNKSDIPPIIEEKTKKKGGFLRIFRICST